MKKKNLIVIALASTALAIGGGVALASSMAPKAIEVKADTTPTKTVGFLNTDNWADVYIHHWGGSGSASDWPGDKLVASGTKIDNHDLYIATVTNENVLFDAGQDKPKTTDLALENVNNNSLYDFANTYWIESHSWGAVGAINGAAEDWNTDKGTCSVRSNPLTQTDAVLTVTLKEGDLFKLRTDGEWGHELGAEDLSAANGTYFEDPDGENAGSNCRVKTGYSGTYTFTLNWRIEMYGEKSYGISVTNFVPSENTDWAVRGNGAAFPDKDGDGNRDFDDGDALPMAVAQAGEVKIIDLALTAGDYFKFTDGTKWYGYSDIKDGSALNGAFESFGDDNIRVKTGYSAKYSFFVDYRVATKAGLSVWITSSDYIAVCDWAEDFAGAEDLCDGEGEEWSVYATSYAGLTDGARAFFAADKVSPSDDPLAHALARAAYRYEWGVAVKNQTAFAETQRPKTGFQANYSAALKLSTNNMQGGVTTAIAVTAAVGAAAAAGFVFLRKRKAI